MFWSPSLVCRGSVCPRWLTVLCVAAAFAGCSDAAPRVKDSATNAAAEAETSTARTAKRTQPANDAPDEESWDVLFIQGSRVGYDHATKREIQENGRTLLRFEGESQLFVKRFGQPTDLGIRINSLETPEGQVLSLTSDAEMGPQATVVTGQVEGGKLRLQTGIAGTKTTHEIAWPADARGYFAIDQELKRRPMEPGQRRTITALQPMMNILAKAELAAADYEETELLTGSYKLLRIECTLDQPGGKLEHTLWADRTGEVMKSYMSAMQMTSYRTTKAVALEKTDATFDLGKMSTVKLSKPLANPHQTRKVRYRVELDGEDPAALFVSGLTQQVNSTGPEYGRNHRRSDRPRHGSARGRSRARLAADGRRPRAERYGPKRRSADCGDGRQGGGRPASSLESRPGSGKLCAPERQRQELFHRLCQCQRSRGNDVGRLHRARRAARRPGARAGFRRVRRLAWYMRRASKALLTTCGPKSTSTIAGFRSTLRSAKRALARAPPEAG